MSGQDVFLTGGTGFIGKHFLKQLSELGRPIRCMTRSTSSLESIRDLNCEIVQGDLEDVDSLSRAMQLSLIHI